MKDKILFKSPLQYITSNFSNRIQGRTIEMLDWHAPKFSTNTIYIDIIFYFKPTRYAKEKKNNNRYSH